MRSLLLTEWQAFVRYYELPGEGPANVYLAGLVFAAQPAFLPVVAKHPALSGQRSILVDLLGAGFSDGPVGFSYSLEDHAQTVAALLDGLDISKCRLIGYSMSGAVAITLAAARPDLVSRLVLLESNLDPLAPGQGLVSTKIAAQSEAEFCAGGFQKLVESLRQLGLAGDGSMANLAGTLQAAAPRALYRSSVSLAQGTQPTMRENLLRLDRPRTFIFGQRTLPSPDWDALASRGVQVLAVPNAGHLMVWDNPQGVAEALDSALAS